MTNLQQTLNPRIERKINNKNVCYLYLSAGCVLRSQMCWTGSDWT